MMATSAKLDMDLTCIFSERSSQVRAGLSDRSNDLYSSLWHAHVGWNCEQPGLDQGVFPPALKAAASLSDVLLGQMFLFSPSEGVRAWRTELTLLRGPLILVVLCSGS